ncbi:MAG: DJ-1/PfpI family protein [Kiritimatiellae bacterium]|nr:DJ-1/PfpI family protein [Kiritimatiellia bacterium]
MKPAGTEGRVRVLIPIADGTEEIEAVTAADLLRRAGAEVCLASVDGETITAGRGTRIVADARWAEVRTDEYDAIVVPGGARGVERLAAHADLLDALRAAHERNRWIGAICAGPLVLEAAGILHGRAATCHPAAASRLRSAIRRDEPVVVDGRIVTSQGVGTAVAFGLTLIECLCGAETARRVALDIVARWP